MALTCNCDNEYDPGIHGFMWRWVRPTFKRLSTKRSRKCASCETRIEVGDWCSKHPRFRYPKPDSVEENILGELAEVELAPDWLCEDCTGDFMHLFSLGYECVSPKSLASDMEGWEAIERERANGNAHNTHT